MATHEQMRTFSLGSFFATGHDLFGCLCICSFRHLHAFFCNMLERSGLTWDETKKGERDCSDVKTKFRVVT